MCVLICLLSKDGRSKAFEHTEQGSSVLSLGRARGVGAGVWLSGKSPCELAAEESPETDLPSSSALGGEPDNARESNDIDRSNGESEY